MKLSTRSRYGARILVELARNQQDTPVQVGDISRRQNISVKYVEQLIRPLKKAQIISSVRGPKGGHFLSKDPATITLGDVVRIFEGQTELIECISNPEKCTAADDCRIRLAWKDGTEALFKSLDATTISDLT